MSPAPSPEARAITAASIKSAPIGAAIVALLFFGSAIARVSRAFLATLGGLAFAVGSAVGAVLLIGAMLGLASGDWQTVLLLGVPYAVPAAVLYRREVLLERAFA